MSIDREFSLLNKTGNSLNNGENMRNSVNKGKNKPSKMVDFIKDSTLKYLIPTLMITFGGIALNKNGGKEYVKKDIQVTDSLRVDRKHIANKIPKHKTIVSGEILGEKEGASPCEFYQFKIGKEFIYLNKHRKLSDEDYKNLFTRFIDVQQGDFGDCYLVSTIRSLARTKYFDTLMKTSIEKNRDGSFFLHLPLGTPNGRKIYISKDELNLAQIQGSLGYRILEVGFAKELFLDKKVSILYTGGTYNDIITEKDMNGVVGKNSFFALAKLLGYNDIKRQFITNNFNRKTLIIKELNKFDPKNFDIIIVSSNRRPKNIPNSQKTYTIENQQMYYHHAYSLYAVEKRGDKIESVILEDPTNTEKKVRLSLSGFMNGFAFITTCSPKTGFLGFT